jgi:hypothetical protein
MNRFASPASILYSTSESGISVLAFETPRRPKTWNRQPAAPTPLSAYPEAKRFYEDYYYTSAALDDVAVVIPCRRQIAGTEVITGLLLRDASGHTSCVGQVRLDSLGDPIEVPVHPPQKLGFSFSSTKWGGHSVSGVVVAPPSEMEGTTWLVLPFRGLLEWWFSFRQCKIHHEGQESPQTCLKSVGELERDAVMAAAVEYS